MKKCICTLIFVVLFHQFLFAQSKFSSFGLNVGTNLLLGETRVADSKISPNIGAFVTYKFSDYLNLKLQTGYGKLGVGLTQKDFSTSFVPVELIGMFSMKNKSKFLPFLQAGLGAFGFKLNDSPTFYDGIFLGGAGFSYEINSDFTFMTSADLRYTTGDDFNGKNGGMKDGYFSFQTGIAYNFNNSSKKHEKEEKFPKNKIIAQEIINSQTDENVQEQLVLKTPKTEEKIIVQIEEDKLADKFDNILAEKNETLLFDGINFKFDSAELSHKATTILENIIHILNEYSGIKIEIQGHTDSVGDLIYNDKLSFRRANTVKNYLIKKGISDQRLIAKGFGEKNPIAVNTTPKGRAKNRRVEFTNLGTKHKILTMFN